MLMPKLGWTVWAISFAWTGAHNSCEIVVFVILSMLYLAVLQDLTRHQVDLQLCPWKTISHKKSAPQADRDKLIHCSLNFETATLTNSQNTAMLSFPTTANHRTDTTVRYHSPSHHQKEKMLQFLPLARTNRLEERIQLVCRCRFYCRIGFASTPRPRDRNQKAAPILKSMCVSQGVMSV